jgi:hypothetical protein
VSPAVPRVKRAIGVSRSRVVLAVSASALLLGSAGPLPATALGAMTIPHLALHTVTPRPVDPMVTLHPGDPAPESAPPVASGCPRTGCPGYPPPNQGEPGGGGTWRPPGGGGGAPDHDEPGPVDPGRPSPGHELDRELTEVQARGPLLCSSYGELAVLYMSIGEALEALGGDLSAANYFYELSGEYTRLALAEPQSLQSRVCITTQDR